MGSVNKSAVTGRFVKESTVKSNPKTTYKQTTSKGGCGPKGKKGK
ncbi:hypothetical protein SAMN04487954_12312 [Billgrantia gudaonensis]|uniref:Uncharacterized protein n=1 Tax=Billgrantia gudaonensis TaxID=376427 RepID=A0A1G9DU49_9GAMM|nr:hypothetical protein SAMN04487954_12312 [Halomonas gudaonensis]